MYITIHNCIDRVQCISIICAYRKETKTRDKKEDSPHLYDEVHKKFSKAIDDEDEIVFDATTLHAHPHNESLYDIAYCYVQSPNEGKFNDVTNSHQLLIM